MTKWNEEAVEFEDVEVIAATPRAILCLFPEGEEVWIPKEQIDPESEVSDNGDYGTLVIPEWLAKNEGLI